MARKPRETFPTSVIIPKEAKAFIKKIAARESRTFSHQVRFILLGWVHFHSKKEDRNHGKESQKGEEVFKNSEEVSP